MENKNMHKKLVIIAGAAGEIGTEFIKGLIEKNIDCIAVLRNKDIDVDSSFLTKITCNLDNEREIEDKFKGIKFEDYQQVICLHTIGVDKFDPRGYPNIKPMETIDPEVYKTNVNSFKYLMRYCIKRIRLANLNNTQEKILFRISIIAGVADKYAPFVIESFCEAKYILRQYIQSQVNLYPEWVSGLSINVTSTVTKSAIAVRPNANTQYWLQPSEVASQSLDILVSNEDSYREIDLIKELPNFVEGYYENNSVLYEKWSRETGIQ